MLNPKAGRKEKGRRRQTQNKTNQNQIAKFRARLNIQIYTKYVDNHKIFKGFNHSN